MLCALVYCFCYIKDVTSKATRTRTECVFWLEMTYFRWLGSFNYVYDSLLLTLLYDLSRERINLKITWYCQNQVRIILKTLSVEWNCCENHPLYNYFIIDLTCSCPGDVELRVKPVIVFMSSCYVDKYARNFLGSSYKSVCCSNLFIEELWEKINC